MKKKLLLASAILCAAGLTQAQSIRFVQNGEVLENNAVITVYEYDEIMNQMKWEPTIRNMTDQDINIMIQTDVISNEDDSFLALCVGGQCYAPTKTETDIITVPAGGETTDFHTQFEPKGDNSKATAYYVLMNIDDEEGTDYQAVTVTYDYPAYLASESLTSTLEQFRLTQNGNNLVCQYSFGKTASRQVVISNMVGARVASFSLDNNSGKKTVTARLSKGIYIYTLVENGRNVKSHKIIIH